VAKCIVTDCCTISQQTEQMLQQMPQTKRKWPS